jgi:hypothetical protein
MGKQLRPFFVPQLQEPRLRPNIVNMVHLTAHETTWAIIAILCYSGYPIQPSMLGP